jgi:hypothetical protein
MIISKHVILKGMLLAATILPGPLIMTSPVSASAQDDSAISCAVAPPALPVYAQPPMPGDGYIWTPGYWLWAAPTGYYWVPGTWIMPPAVGVLWTPPYWGWVGGVYLFHIGYWGPHVGYYGGINYGYGYGGSGYDGGHWDGGHFAYNRNVTNIGSVHVANAYRQSVPGGNVSRASYAGGSGRVGAEPSAVERGAESEQHLSATSEQANHNAAAARHPGLVASHNAGRPVVAATTHAAVFTGRGVVRAQAAHAQATHQAAAPRAANHQQAAHQQTAHGRGGNER